MNVVDFFHVSRHFLGQNFLLCIFGAKINQHLQQTDLELPSLPDGDSIYDYNVNPETGR